MNRMRSVRGGFLPGWIALLLSLAAMVLLAGCKGKSGSPSALQERAMGGGATQKVSGATNLLMESIDDPKAALHISYKAQKNINPKFPMEAEAKPEMGPVEVEADVTPDGINVSETVGSKKTSAKAARTDEMGWPMAKLEVMGPLLDVNIALAFGGVVARPGGSDSVGGIAADRFDMDTANAPAAAKAGFEMAAAMLGGKVKINSVKGSAWVDKANGRLVKFNVDTELSDKQGNSWTEHHEGLVTPK